MGEWKSLGVDFNGIEDFVGEEDGKIVFRRSCADVEPLLDRNQAEFNNGPQRGTFRKLASIPIGLIEIWKMQYGVDPTARGQERLLSRLLNDSDLRKLRTSPGVVDMKERSVSS